MSDRGYQELYDEEVEKREKAEARARAAEERATAAEAKLLQVKQIVASLETTINGMVEASANIRRYLHEAGIEIE